MIISILEFSREALHSVVASFFKLPKQIRPTHYSVGEDDADEPIHDQVVQLETLAKRTSGFFLKGTSVTYDINLAGSKPIICNCSLEVEPSLGEYGITSYNATAA